VKGGLFSSGAALGREVADRVSARLGGGPVLTRFAPAPTGALHLGHVVNAVYVWGLARALGGRVLLRIEDHDRQRSRASFERALLDDLDWLGFDADVHPSDCYRRGSCDGRQSERDAIYRAALAPLVDAGLIYGCRCSRAALAAAPASSSGERRYPGTCRDAGLPLDDTVSWRLAIAPGTETFDDAVLGAQEQNPSAQCGDLLLRDRLGNWTYQGAAAIDDWLQGVTLVVRGEDILPSTGRQIRLARLVGRATPPLFAHHPLIMKSATQKLSKSDGDAGVADLRRAGWTAADIIGCAARLVGLTTDRAPFAARDLPVLFAP
jgi:glutamyl/glutaminyl-tRNA synthetase